MKFNQHLQQNIKSEWARYYLSYKSLKRIIKSAIGGKAAKTNPRETGNRQSVTLEFTNFLLTEAAKIETFYQKQFKKWTELCVKCKLQFLQADESSNISIDDHEEITAKFQALNDMDHKVCDLFNYCQLNKTGIKKILKKYYCSF